MRRYLNRASMGWWGGQAGREAEREQGRRSIAHIAIQLLVEKAIAGTRAGLTSFVDATP